MPDAKQDPSRFAATAMDFVPLGKPTTVDHLTPEQQAQNRAHAAALEAIFEKEDEAYLKEPFEDDAEDQA